MTNNSKTDTNLLLVIFGGTGDLANRKLLPAAYNLFFQNGSQAPMQVLSLGRRAWSAADYHAEIKPWVEKFARLKFDDEKFQEFSKTVDFLEMQISEKSDYEKLFAYLDEHYPKTQKMFYYAVAPALFSAISKGLQLHTWAPEENVKVIIEKPFGEDLAQAKALHKEIADVFGEEQIYHIDHYLGKEMIQNISTLRFENMIFRSCWNRQFIHSVEISAMETVGVETRGQYYDLVGATRDMVQNHLFQIMSILAMEEPEKQSPFAVTVAQQNLLQALRPIEARDLDETLVLAQYDGYTSEKNVDIDSRTDTYAAIVVHIDNPRWHDVPFFIRTGKKLSHRGTKVVIHFKPSSESTLANQLIIQIQPDEGVKLSFNIKEPGLTTNVEQVQMDFCQSCLVRAHENTPEAYERLICAAAEGQRYLFSQWPQIEFSWRWIDQLIRLWENAGKPLAIYQPGGNGPAEADALTADYGIEWNNDDSEFNS